MPELLFTPFDESEKSTDARKEKEHWHIPHVHADAEGKSQQKMPVLHLIR